MLPPRATWTALALQLCLLQLNLIPTYAEESPAFTKASNDSLLWGAYRPNLYFGIRPRLPKSIMTGLMWARVDDYKDVQNNFRYTCEQHEGMAGYGWDNYDPRLGGTQTIHDAGNGIDIVTEFVKHVDRGVNGGSWSVRIKGTPRANMPSDLATTVLFNIGLEGHGSMQTPEAADGQDSTKGFEGDIKIAGETPDLGAFGFTITKGKGEHPSNVVKTDKLIDRTRVHSMELPDQAIWQAKAVMFSLMKTTIDDYVKQFGEAHLPAPWQTYDIAHNPGKGNLHFIQKTFKGAFEFEVHYAPRSDDVEIATDTGKESEAIAQNIRAHYDKVQKPKAPFDKPEYLDFSLSLFSNLIGGIGYFAGDQVIDRSYAAEYDEDSESFWLGTAEARARRAEAPEGPYELFTSIPSRPFFPRGFLWDEGFHLLPILDSDIELTMQIVKSWFNTMDKDGWIPREQILGPEARSKVPAEFQVQYPHYANPPTLFFVLGQLIDKIDTIDTNQQQRLADDTTSDSHMRRPIESNTQIKAYLRDLYPLLVRHFEWFRRTQRGEVSAYDRKASHPKEAYRWRGSTETHILTSGMDDYPRAKPPHPGELHVDLLSWMGLMARNMHKIASALEISDDAEKYNGIASAIVKNIDDLHWSEKHKTYCDASIDAYEESYHVCHKGYLSLFPFMTGLMDPQSTQMGALLDLISDPAELWSSHGIRSLSKKDQYYGIGENYWRSPVWMNMNYLIVRELRNVGLVQGPYQEKARDTFSKLRRNLITTVYKSWKETGFAWEQYNPDTGAGQRTQHFTGWTSLVVKIMSMEDLDLSRRNNDAKQEL